MQKISKVSRTIWLRTDRAVVPTKTTNWHHLLAVQNALCEGLFAIADSKRPEFFEIEVANAWYYIHIPSRIAGVYLIAAGGRSCEVTDDLFLTPKTQAMAIPAASHPNDLQRESEITRYSIITSCCV